MRIESRISGCRPEGNRRRKSKAPLRISSPSFESLESRQLLSLSPFLGSPVAISSTPGTSTIVQADNFDNGGEGVAYHTTDTTNLGGAYRPNEGVSIQPTSDPGSGPGSGYNVGWTVAGDWLGYSVNVAAAGNYDITVRIASAGAVGNNAGYFHLEFGPTGQVGGSERDQERTVRGPGHRRLADLAGRHDPGRPALRGQSVDSAGGGHRLAGTSTTSSSPPRPTRIRQTRPRTPSTRRCSRSSRTAPPPTRRSRTAIGPTLQPGPSARSPRPAPWSTSPPAIR